MNVKELETAFAELQTRVDRMLGQLEALTAEASSNKGAFEALADYLNSFEQAMNTLHGRVDQLSNDGARQQEHNTAIAVLINSMGVESMAMNERMGAMLAGLEAHGASIDDLRAKVEGRNKSAPVKRNMTDEDALRVLKGDLVQLGHKEAAEKVGLTYAQVYSCRLGFTFKHVIKDLEKDGWRSPWAKG